MMVSKASAAQGGAKVHACSDTPSPQQSGAKANASSDTPNLFPSDWDQIDISSEGQDLDMHGPEEDPQAVAHAATIQEEKDLMKSWHPTCLTKANVRLCLHEGSQEVLLYKHLFDIQDLAESELTREIELARKRLTTMQIDPDSFTLDIALTQQRIAQLEDKRTKEDCSTHTTGEHHTTGGRLHLVLGNHISNVAKEEEIHANTIAVLEAQIAHLKANMAREERIFAVKAAANENVRAELQAMVSSYSGPQRLLAQMQTEQATAKMDELTPAAFSQDWLNANAINSVVPPEMLKVLVTQAMNVALKAQHMGISITPPQPATLVQPMQQQQQQEQQQQQLQHIQLQQQQQQLQVQQQVILQQQVPTDSSQSTGQTAASSASFGPSPLETLNTGGLQATRAAAPYEKKKPGA